MTADRLVQGAINRLLQDGYKIFNMKITSVGLTMSNYGIVFMMTMECSNYGATYDEDYCLRGFNGLEEVMPYITDIMNIIGVEHINDMVGKYVRVATRGLGSSVKIIGNIVEDQWFDPESFLFRCQIVFQ